MDKTTRNNLTKLRAYVDALLAADSVLSEPEPMAVEPVDVEVWKISQRNRVLAGSGDKSALLGTLSTDPTVGALDLIACGADQQIALDLERERDTLRAKALALVAAPVAPKALEVD